jgi:hypothetical protein
MTVECKRDSDKPPSGINATDEQLRPVTIVRGQFHGA